MSDKPMTMGDLMNKFLAMPELKPSTPVIFEIIENGDNGTANWALDEVEVRNGFVVLKSID
jgi:hypothetical protein